MTLRQMLAAWLIGSKRKKSDRIKKKRSPNPTPSHAIIIADGGTKVVPLTTQQRTSFFALCKYRAAHGLPVPTIEQYAAHLSGGESVYLKTKTRRAKG